MLAEFIKHIEKFALCTKTDPLLLAVSGGIDSISMLYLFREAEFNIAVAHCNFQLRGKDSDADEIFVTTVCKELGIPVYVKRFETEAYAWEKTLSTQIAARELRYAWFEELIAAHSYKYLATAHHFDDTMETILLNLTRGAGLDGLAGIPMKNGYTIRPLLFSTRKDIEQYAIRKGLVWREDLSNTTDDYQRNFIRHNILPKLKELNPSLESTWRSGLEKVKGEMTFLLHAFDEWKSNYVVETPGRVEIHKKAFILFPNSPGRLWRFCRTFGFNFDQSKDILQCLHGQPGKRFISHTHQLVIDRETIIITERQQHWSETVIEDGQPGSFLGPWRLTIEEATGDIDHSAVHSAVFDAGVLTFPLIWRKWKAGDFFYPLGLGHKKKLSDFFTDIKLSVADKDNITVIESGGRIAWIPGYRIDDRFKLTDHTDTRIKLSLLKS